MEINLPFRLKDIYKKSNLKTESNKINLEKRKKQIYKNIKYFWGNDTNSLDIKSPAKNKLIRYPLSIIGNQYKSRNIKSLSIEKSENNIHEKRNLKKPIFEKKNYFERKNNYNFSFKKRIFNKKEEEQNFTNNNFYTDIKKNNLIIKYTNININSKGENEKIHNINLPEVKMNNIPPNSFLDENKFFVNLNSCLNNFINKYNKEAVIDFLKKQQKKYYSSPNKNNFQNNEKVIKTEKKKCKKYKKSFCLEAIITYRTNSYI